MQAVETRMPSPSSMWAAQPSIVLAPPMSKPMPVELVNVAAVERLLEELQLVTVQAKPVLMPVDVAALLVLEFAPQLLSEL
jgi:hypothetical protein